MSTFADRLKEARLAAGFESQIKFAKAAGVSPAAIGMWESGARGMPTGDRLLRVAAAARVRPEWLAGGPEHGEGGKDSRAPEPQGVPNTESPGLHIVAAPVLEWDNVKRIDLPEKFLLVMRDDSMAPEFKKGSALFFSTNEGPPRPMDVVLVVDKEGTPYCRRYQQKTPSVWEAVAHAPGYLPLKSVEDGLQVLAIYMGSVNMGRLG